MPKPHSLYVAVPGFCSQGAQISPQLAATSTKPSRLTFLVLEPQLLLDLLAGEVDDTGELGAVEGLCQVVRAIVLDEGEQLLPAALLAQDLEHVGEAWTGRSMGRRSESRGWWLAISKGQGALSSVQEQHPSLT